MSYQAGVCGWAVEPEPKWEHAEQYEKDLRELLDKLLDVSADAAENDYPRFDWLINEIRFIMESCCSIARKAHGDDD